MNFSVSMCVYGGDDPVFLKIALESVVNQTLVPDEIVLVVDGPVPASIDDVINEFNNEHGLLNVIRLPENVGHGNARRRSMSECKNEMIALMDADDVCCPDRFEKQMAVFEKNPNVSCVGGQIAEFVGDVDNVVGYRIVPEEDADIKKYMKKRCPMNQVTVMFKKSAVEDVGGYIDWYCNEDYYLWLRLAKAGYVLANVKDTLLYVRTNIGTYNRRGGRKYYKSEKDLQKWMLDNKLISFPRYLFNVLIRFVSDILITDKVRGILYNLVLREKKNA